MAQLTNRIQVVNNVMYGKLYGYSDCCIRYFHMRQVNGDMMDPDQPVRHHQGTGFICCPKCNEEKNAFQIHVEIAGRRRTSVPFMSHGEPTKEELDRVKMTEDDIVSLSLSILDDLQEYINI